MFKARVWLILESMFYGGLIGAGLMSICITRSHADSLTDADQQYINDHGWAICAVFEQAPTRDTIAGMGVELVQKHGMTSGEAATVIVYSIAMQCPNDEDQLLAVLGITPTSPTTGKVFA